MERPTGRTSRSWAGPECAAAFRWRRRWRFHSKPGAGPFPFRDLLIFITFVVLLATLVGQGGSLPWLIRWLKIKDDGAAAKEERLALLTTAQAGIERLDELKRTGKYPESVLELHRRRLQARFAEFTASPDSRQASKNTALFRNAQRELVEAERRKLIHLRERGKIDNTVLRRLQRVFDLETIEAQLLEAAGHSDLEQE